MKFTAVVLDWRQMTREERFAVCWDIGTPADRERTSGTEAALRAVLERGAFHAYELEAADREEVFAILNRAPGREEAAPASYAQERSLSVGDLVIDEGGAAYCHPVGWWPLSRFPSAAAALDRALRARPAA